MKNAEPGFEEGGDKGREMGREESREKDGQSGGKAAPENAGESAPAEMTRKSHRRFLRWPRFRFGIQSKILVALLLSSILGVAVIGFIGTVAGRDALAQVESERLIELRGSQKRALEALFRQVTNSLIVYSGGFSIVEATDARSPRASANWPTRRSPPPSSRRSSTTTKPR